MNEIYPVRLVLYYSGASYVDGKVISSVPQSVLSAYQGTNSRSGTSLPNWRERIARGESATTDFIGQETYVTRKQGEILTLWKDTYGPYPGKARKITVKGDLFQGPTPSASSLSSAAAQAKAYADFKSQISDLNRSVEGLAFIGEIRETVKMLRSPLQSLRKAVGSYLPTLQRRLRNTKRNQWRAVIGSTWLEWRFGVRPLVMDLHGIVKALASHGEWRPAFALEAYGKDVSSSFTNTSVTDPAYARHVFRMGQKTIDETAVRYKVGIRARTYPDRGSFTLMGELGLEMDRFVPSLYEVMPYSWLVDYFTNASDVLLHRWVNQSEVAWVNATDRKKRSIYTTGALDAAATRAAYSNPPEFCCVADVGWQMAVHKVVSRTALSEVPVPPVVFWTPKIGSVRWLNIAGLIAQQNAWTVFRRRNF